MFGALYMYISGKDLTYYRTRAIISRGLYIFYPISNDHFFVFKEVFFRKFCPYLWLVFKSGLWWHAYGICIGKKSFIYISMVARVSKDSLCCKSTTNFGEDDEKLQWHLCHEPEVSSLVFRLLYKSNTKWNLFFGIFLSTFLSKSNEMAYLRAPL